MPHARFARAAIWIIACALSAACSREAAAPAGTVVAPAAPPATPSRPADSGRPKIVVLGDSLTAGLGLDPVQAYPALLQKKLDAAGYQWDVANAGVSGDTSAAGLQRLDW